MNNHLHFYLLFKDQFFFEVHTVKNEIKNLMSSLRLIMTYSKAINTTQNEHLEILHKLLTMSIIFF